MRIGTESYVGVEIIREQIAEGIAFFKKRSDFITQGIRFALSVAVAAFRFIRPAGRAVVLRMWKKGRMFSIHAKIPLQ